MNGARRRKGNVRKRGGFTEEMAWKRKIKWVRRVEGRDENNQGGEERR